MINDEFLLASGDGLNFGWLAPAFGAGVLSFISPCVLPLAPVYVAHLAGQISADPAVKGN